ncbi:unnamed protein product [Rotaria socialis]|uniref:Craniofacial development protein 2-like n=1 Tax=Rotaria socialis TaxID=392032 RepID=A0A819BRY4_9BILA|nr:unnamed protein product [Rotaria socialis]
MNDQNLKSYRLRRHPREEGPSPLSSKQEIIEKLDTGNTGTTATVTSKVKIGKQRWKIMKDTLTVGTWNVQTLWVTRKLELLRNEMKRFRFDVIGISEVR